MCRLRGATTTALGGISRIVTMVCHSKGVGCVIKAVPRLVMCPPVSVVPCEQVSVTNADIHLLAMGPYPVPVREGFSNGTLIEVECHKFYTPSHHPVLTCHNGRWDSDIPTCDCK